MFRRQLVGMLSAEGMSNRSIASTVQVDERTVRRDQVRHVAAPEVGPLDPPSSDPDPDISAVVSPVSAPSAVTPEDACFLPATIERVSVERTPLEYYAIA